MRFNSFKSSFPILLALSIIIPLLVSLVIAKPLSTNPGQAVWPSGTVWGTNLRFENNDNASSPSTSEIWWGVGASDGLTASPPDPPAGLIVEFLDDIGNNYATWVKAAAAEPASYTWSVQFRKVKN